MVAPDTNNSPSETKQDQKATQATLRSHLRGLFTNSLTGRWIGFGSVISILSGLVLGVVVNDVRFGIVVGIMGEAISLTIGLMARINEVEQNVILRLREHNELFNLVQRVAEVDEPHLTQRLKTYRHALRELSEGRYSLSCLEDVYEDDKQSIRAMQPHHVLRSTCPVRGTLEDVRNQFQNRSFLGSIEAHKHAVERGVYVVRVFSFENRELSRLPLITEHMNALEQAGVECYSIFPNEPEFHKAQQVRTDFVIFGETKVSLGILSARGEVVGAEVNYNRDNLEEYTRQFDLLVELGERHKSGRGQLPSES